MRETAALEQLDILLVLDASASMDWGRPSKLGYAIQAAAALGYIGLARHDTVTIVHLHAGGSSTFGPLRGPVRFRDLLRHLGTVEPEGAVDLAAGLSAALPRARSVSSLVVLLSDLLAPTGVEAGLDALRRSCPGAVVLHLLSPQELEPDARGELELVDAETDEILEVGLTGEVLTAYRARLDNWLGEQQAACTSRGLRYVRTRTDRSFERLLLDDLRCAGVLR